MTGFVAVGGGVYYPPTGPPWLGNQPVGNTIVDSRPFNSLTEFESPHSPAWFTDSNSNRFIVTDATAPQSPSNCLRCFFPSGFIGGSGGGVAECPLPSLRILYVTYWAKYSANWQGHGTGFNKQSYYWAGGAPITYFEAHGGGNADLFPQVVLQGTPADAVLPANLATSKTIPRDIWFLIELLLTGNTASTANGVVDFWVDGIQCGHYTGQQFTSGATQWETAQIAPVWGGAGDAVDFDMSLDVDHMYLSMQ